MPGNDARGLEPEQARRIAEECYGEVLAYCRRHAPAGHEAADLAQETFLRFVRAGSYRERGKPIAYLMRIARSVCVDASRARQLETVALDFDVPDESDVPDEFSGISGIGGADVPCAAGVTLGSPPGSPPDGPFGGLGEALAKLPGDLREAVELRFGTGLGVNEVARALGISRFAARRRINAALKRLENDLKEGGSDE